MKYEVQLFTHGHAALHRRIALLADPAAAKCEQAQVLLVRLPAVPAEKLGELWRSTICGTVSNPLIGNIQTRACLPSLPLEHLLPTCIQGRCHPSQEPQDFT